MDRTKVFLYYQATGIYRQYKELFPFKELQAKFEVHCFMRGKGYFNEVKEFRISNFLRSLHALLHYCEVKRRTYTTLFYLNRATFVLGLNPFQKKFIEIPVHKKLNLMKRILVIFLANSLGILFIRQLLHFFFYLESNTKSKELEQFRLFILPYTGGFSVEWDFLAWWAKKHNVASIGIQENWDNLSSKSFLIEAPTIFLTWGPQSASHLRVYQNFKGIVFESGCLREQHLYQLRRLSLTNKISHQSDLGKFGVKILWIDSGYMDSDEELLNKFSEHFNLGKNFSNKFEVVYRAYPYLRQSWQYSILERIKKIPGISVYYDLEESNSSRLNQILNSDIVISTFSTYVLEASILNKKCIVPTFDCGIRYLDNSKLIDDIAHFHGMSLLEGIEIAESWEKLICIIENFKFGEITFLNNEKLLNWFLTDSDTRNHIANLVLEYATYGSSKKV
jgi:hypothetical protein